MEDNRMSPEMEASFAEMRRTRERLEKALPEVRRAGAEALVRLMHVARGHSGQCRVVAAFLLSLYNGNRFKFDLTDFRTLDFAIFEDCMRVLRMDFQPQTEVHNYFENGSELFEGLAADWRITDYHALRLQFE